MSARACSFLHPVCTSWLVRRKCMKPLISTRKDLLPEASLAPRRVLSWIFQMSEGGRASKRRLPQTIERRGGAVFGRVEALRFMAI